MTNPVTPMGGTPVPPPRGGMPKWLLILIVILIIIIFGCCGGVITCGMLFKKGAQKLQENAPGWQAQIEQQAREAQARAADAGRPGKGPSINGRTAPADNGEEAVVSTKLPSNFPSDVPVYSGLSPTYSMADKTKNSGVVMFNGAGDPEKVSAYYQKELEAKGWKQETNTTFNNMTVLKYSKDEQTVNLSIVPEDGKLTVTMQYGKP